MPRANPKQKALVAEKTVRPAKPVGAEAKPRKAAGKKAKSKVIAAEAVATDAASDAASAVALILPDCLDSSAASVVKDMLLARRGSALMVDASEVRRVGAQSLQILVAAARTWQADGHRYVLANASSEFLNTIALIGLPREDLMLEGSFQ